MRSLRLTALSAVAVSAILGATLLAGCGAAPGSVSGDPLAQQLVAAEQQQRGWAAARTTMVFDGSGQLGSASLPSATAISGTEMTISAGDVGDLTIDTRDEQTTERPEIPEKSCVDEGSPFTSQSEMESIFR